MNCVKYVFPLVSLAGCYGVSCDEAELDDWLCARCEANAITEVS